MSIRTTYLRKKFWINDFLAGGQMWKHFQDATQIIVNEGITGKGSSKRAAYLKQLLD